MDPDDIVLGGWENLCYHEKEIFNFLIDALIGYMRQEGEVKYPLEYLSIELHIDDKAEAKKVRDTAKNMKLLFDYKYTSEKKNGKTKDYEATSTFITTVLSNAETGYVTLEICRQAIPVLIGTAYQLINGYVYDDQETTPSEHAKQMSLYDYSSLAYTSIIFTETDLPDDNAELLILQIKANYSDISAHAVAPRKGLKEQNTQWLAAQKGNVKILRFYNPFGRRRNNKADAENAIRRGIYVRRKTERFEE